MIAGESIYVILAELFPVVHKLLKTDSQSALAILTNEGGNWRTRLSEFCFGSGKRGVALAP